MTSWEYARLLVAPPRVIDRSADVDQRAVIMINTAVQDYKNSPEDPFDVLNEMGGEGWELAEVVVLEPPTPNAARATGMWEYLLKRQR